MTAALIACFVLWYIWLSCRTAGEKEIANAACALLWIVSIGMVISYLYNEHWRRRRIDPELDAMMAAFESGSFGPIASDCISPAEIAPDCIREWTNEDWERAFGGITSVSAQDD